MKNPLSTLLLLKFLSLRPTPSFLQMMEKNTLQSPASSFLKPLQTPAWYAVLFQQIVLWEGTLLVYMQNVILSIHLVRYSEYMCMWWLQSKNYWLGSSKYRKDTTLIMLPLMLTYLLILKKNMGANSHLTWKTIKLFGSTIVLEV